MFLVELGDEAVLTEDLFVVGFRDPEKVVDLGLDLGVPVFVKVQQLWIQVVAEQGAAGRADIAGLVGLDGEDVAALFVTVKGFHFSLVTSNGISCGINHQVCASYQSTLKTWAFY